MRAFSKKIIMASEASEAANPTADNSTQYYFMGLDGGLHLSLNKRVINDEPIDLNEPIDVTEYLEFWANEIDYTSDTSNSSEMNKLKPQMGRPLDYTSYKSNRSELNKLEPQMGRPCEQVLELLKELLKTEKKTYVTALLEITRVLGLVGGGILRPSDYKLYVVNESINALYIGMTSPETSGDSVVTKPLIYDVFCAMNTWFPGPCPGYPDPFPR